jgi:predicted Zn-dependent peptidase
VGFFIDRGTRDEPEGLFGAAHFIEHLVFKGTKKRSAFEIAKSLEAVGGDLNAYTTRESTCFHSLSLRDHLPISLDVLCDLVTNALFENKDFKSERDVILQEADMSKDQLDEWIYDILFAGSFRGHALGRAILGDRKSLQKMSRTKLKNYYQNVYRGSQLVISMAGPVDHDEVVKNIEKQLLFFSDKKHRPIQRKPPRIHNFKKLIQRHAEQAHILLSWPSTSFTDSLRFESYVANAVLGGGMTSRMYQTIREEKGLAYSVYSSLQSFTDCGLLTVYAATSKTKAPQTLELLWQQTEHLIDKGLSQAELDFYKTQIKGQILLGADDMENRMNSLGVNEMVFGSYRPVEQVIEDIDAVSMQSVRNYLDQFFKISELKAIVLGDVMSQGIEKQLAKL